MPIPLKTNYLCLFLIPRKIPAWQKGLLLRYLRQLLPFQEGLPGEIFIPARAMSKQLRQRLKVPILSNEAAFEISFKHHADIEG